PNTFLGVPWPVFTPVDRPLAPSDVNPESVRAFFDRPALRTFKTEREIDMIMKNTVRRFHPDRFNEKRLVISSIRDATERAAVLQAADIVIKTMNAVRTS
ncbi:hypothetical protein GGX14DRAFT_382724, partial [Mycena pura]